LAKIRDFGLSEGFSGPWDLPGPRPEGWFYINPSRRGPVPGRGGVPEPLRLGAGVPLKGGRGSPPGE